MNKKTKFITGTVAGFVLGISGLFYAGRKTDLLDGSMNVKLESGCIDVPTYNLIKLRPGSCSKYVRMAAKELFGKNYDSSNAWNRKYHDSIVSKIDNNEELNSLEQLGELKPGMIVGVYVPTSSYNGIEDELGKKVGYTHVMLYLGKGKDGNLLFAEQFRTKVRIRNLEEMNEDNLVAREVLDARVK